MKRYSQSLLFMIVACGAMPALAEMNSADLIGEWCLVHQSMHGHDFETLPAKAISDKLKAKPGQSYHFKDGQTVEVMIADKSQESFEYKISGSKKNRIRIKRWQSFAVKSFTESEIVATVYGTVDHRFTRGVCELS